MPTIRGTGSLFLRDLLSPPFSRVTLRGGPAAHSLVFDHLYSSRMPHFWRWMERFPTIIMPIRAPESVAQTWHRRGEKWPHFFEQWDNWAQLAPRAIILPVDLPEKRDEALTRISEAVGMPIETDWAPVNVTTVSRGTEEIPDSVLGLYDIPQIRELYA